MTDLEFNTTIETLLTNNLLITKKGEKKTYSIDPFELIKTIKQLAYVIKDLKQNKKDIQLSFLVSNKFIKTNVQQFLLKLNLNSKIKVAQNLNEIKSENLVVLCGDFEIKELDYILKRLFAQNKYIFNIITPNENIYSRNNSSYIIHNENKELKKIFYFVALIDKLITN
jgi:uncharacterized protein YeeX (DUF496 family)